MRLVSTKYLVHWKIYCLRLYALVPFREIYIFMTTLYIWKLVVTFKFVISVNNDYSY